MKLSLKIFLFSFALGSLILAFGFFLRHQLDFELIVVFGFFLFAICQFLFIRFLTSGIEVASIQLSLTRGTKEPLVLDGARFKELADLQLELNAFSFANHENYLSQKRYSENLSHELLTPLAIIRTKAELLLQAPDLREVDLQHLDSIIQTVGRLSNLNRGLILLSKIDNRQFVDKEQLNIAELVSESLENFEDQIRKKKLAIRVDFTEKLQLESNLNLMRILIANLIKNAIFHNIEEGYVQINLNGQTLRIENAGLPNDHDPNLFFQRFVSDKNSDYSVGLGLSIVKEICQALGFTIKYDSVDAVHILQLNFLTKV